MNDIEKLLNGSMPFIEETLKKHGEFYPLASAIRNDGDLANIAVHKGDDKHAADELIEQLTSMLTKTKDKYRAAAVFSNVTVKHPDNNKETDAIAVYLEEKRDFRAFTFFYPYEIDGNNNLLFSDPWANEIKKQIWVGS